MTGLFFTPDLLPIEMLISFGDTLTDTPRNNVLPAFWASPSLVKWTDKIHCHTYACYYEAVLYLFQAHDGLR